MKKRRSVVLCSVGLWWALACAVAGAGVNFAPSTYNPGVGEPVTFEVCAACLGSSEFRFTWDFGDNGFAGFTTADLSVTHRFDREGYVRVELSARDSSGLAFSRTKEILVGASPLVAVRETTVEDHGTILVRITLLAQAGLSSLALTETIPHGWQAQVVDGGGLVNPAGGSLQVLWMEAVDSGQVSVFTYRLLPTGAGGLPELRGDASAYRRDVATGEPQKRVKVTVCGDVTIPDY